MPRFDYQCPVCGAVAEFSDREQPYCVNPDCFTKEPLQKLPPAPSFVIRGFSAANGYAK